MNSVAKGRGSSRFRPDPRHPHPRHPEDPHNRLRPDDEPDDACKPHKRLPPLEELLEPPPPGVDPHIFGVHHI
jgi:hypothetical protein